MDRLNRPIINKNSDSHGRLRQHGGLLFISVLLHSALMLFSWQEKSRPLAVSPTPVDPISVVDASQLMEMPAEIPEPESQPLPVAPSSSLAPPVAVLPPVTVPINTPTELPPTPLPDAPVAEKSDRPVGEPDPEAAPYSDPVPAAKPPKPDSIPPDVTPID